MWSCRTTFKTRGTSLTSSQSSAASPTFSSRSSTYVFLLTFTVAYLYCSANILILCFEANYLLVILFTDNFRYTFFVPVWLPSHTHTLTFSKHFSPDTSLGTYLLLAFLGIFRTGIISVQFLPPSRKFNAGVCLSVCLSMC